MQVVFRIKWSELNQYHIDNNLLYNNKEYLWSKAVPTSQLKHGSPCSYFIFIFIWIPYTSIFATIALWTANKILPDSMMRE